MTTDLIRNRPKGKLVKVDLTLTEAALIGRALDFYLDAQANVSHDESLLAWMFSPADLSGKAFERVEDWA